ncbi:glutamate racemase [Saonia flava]|uniref:Glutamate racemase n=1 Tax=Saonia flava TaxID=523696 RepID=A0A846QS19_9FLAO|nr:glutamate racemase [Saonia flava]NJB70868.1 glutamate racemase [Saonia flava]
MKNNPIGIFDSGVGGTSIWKEINTMLPDESTIYLADSKNAPYGAKKPKEILRLSIKNTELLLKMGCKLIVVACNTATTNAIHHLRENYDVPFIGIEPAIKPAALKSNSKKVGVLATKGTLSSALFHKTSNDHASGITIIEMEGAGLVPLIEAGKIDSKETKELLDKILQPMLKEEIDYLVLGCTHYPYLMEALRELLPKHIQVIDSGEAVARQTKAILEKNGILRIKGEEATYQFYSNGNASVLRSLLGITGKNVSIDSLDF